MARIVRRRKPAPPQTLLESALEKLAVTFEPKEGCDPFRLPVAPFPLGDVIDVFFGDDTDPLEVWENEPGDRLLTLIWDGGGCSSTWTLYGVTLPSRRRVYVAASEEENDKDIIAATPPTFIAEELDCQLIELLSRDNGAAFGIGVVGGLPDRISFGVPVGDRVLIVHRLFKAADVLGELVHAPNDPSGGRKAVSRWLLG